MLFLFPHSVEKRDANRLAQEQHASTSALREEVLSLQEQLANRKVDQARTRLDVERLQRTVDDMQLDKDNAVSQWKEKAAALSHTAEIDRKKHIRSFTK
jgi:hypothetical protein